MSKTPKFYQTDLAYVHDQSYSDLARAAADYLMELLSERDPAKTSIVDLGCGSGVFAEPLAKAGYKVTGIDYSEDMVTLASERVPQAKFVQASFLDYKLPKCHAVTAIGEVLNYQFDTKNNFKAIKGLFENVYQQLTKGGIFLFDLIEPGIQGIMAESNRKVEGKDWSMFLQLIEDWETATLTRDITLFRKVGDLYRKSHEVHRVYLHHHYKVQSALEEVGFKVEMIHAYGDHAFRNKHVGFVARK